MLSKKYSVEPFRILTVCMHSELTVLKCFLQSASIVAETLVFSFSINFLIQSTVLRAMLTTKFKLTKLKYLC